MQSIDDPSSGRNIRLSHACGNCQAFEAPMANIKVLVEGVERARAISSTGKKAVSEPLVAVSARVEPFSASEQDRTGKSTGTIRTVQSSSAKHPITN